MPMVPMVPMELGEAAEPVGPTASAVPVGQGGPWEQELAMLACKPEALDSHTRAAQPARERTRDWLGWR
ncbi:MAG: hypothetical protein ACKO38_03850, partial [Planctomycetota bacterium]